ncbi:MAG TPA: serine hydrolase domain-containing protein [Blastocatellia bacterium]|nr:serine hydrolase domain-containing protein [Blastocatellia bacterium]
MLSQTKKFTLVLLLTCSFAVAGASQTAQSETPALRRAKEFVKLLDSGNRAELRKYAGENFAPNFLNIPMEQHLDFLSSVHDFTRGVEFHSVQAEKPNEVTALLKARLTGEWLAVVVRVEPQAPYRIAGLGLRQPKPPASEQSARKLTNEQVAQELDAFVRKLVDADLFSGTVLLAKDGVPIFKGAYGIANKDFNVPNRIDTKFNLGSMNKMFTAVAIAQLVERGKLSFDDPLAKYIPDFPDKASAEKIKIKNLLTHTAGLGGYFSKQWSESSRALYRTVDDMMKRAAADEKLQFEPGTKWQYSNTGMLVLGAVIEKVTGQSYYDYVRENITKPAAMINSDCYELDKVNPNLAVGYDKEFSDAGVSFKNNIFMHVLRGGPQGGGYSTVEDLLKFAVALRSNKLVGAEYVKLLLSPKPELNSPGYGYGFQIETDAQIAGHGGGFPGINSNLDMFLGSGWTAIVMSNYSRGAQPVQEKMRALVASTLDARASK